MVDIKKGFNLENRGNKVCSVSLYKQQGRKITLYPKNSGGKHAEYLGEVSNSGKQYYAQLRIMGLILVGIEPSRVKESEILNEPLELTPSKIVEVPVVVSVPKEEEIKIDLPEPVLTVETEGKKIFKYSEIYLYGLTKKELFELGKKNGIDFPEDLSKTTKAMMVKELFVNLNKE